MWLFFPNFTPNKRLKIWFLTNMNQIMNIRTKSFQISRWNFILTENSISESTCLRVIVCRYLVEFYRKMLPKKKQHLSVLPGQKTLFSFLGRDGNNNFVPDDSVRKETETMIDSGSQDVQVVRIGTWQWWYPRPCPWPIRPWHNIIRKKYQT